eukprot:2264533-Rhodomonas_salina.1
MAGATGSEHVPPLCEEVYRLEDIKVLNELSIPHAVLDCRARTARCVWANEACLAAFDVDLAEIQRKPLLDPRSSSEMEIQSKLYETVQMQQGVCTSESTVYPNGRAFTANWSCRPIQLMLDDLEEDDDEVQTFCLVALHPIAKERAHAKAVVAGVSEMCLQQMEVITMVFDESRDGFESTLYANLSAQKFYSCDDAFQLNSAGARGHHGGSSSQRAQLTLEDVIGSCELDEDVREETRQRINNLSLQSRPLEFVCKKQQRSSSSSSSSRQNTNNTRGGGGGSGSEEGGTWHR